MHDNFLKILAFASSEWLVILNSAGWLAMAVLGVRLRRWTMMLAGLLAANLVLIFLSSLIVYLKGLSIDSFAEVTWPDPTEVKFYLQSLVQIIEPLSIRRYLIALCLAAGLTLFALSVLGRRAAKATAASRFGWFAIILSGVFLVAEPIGSTLEANQQLHAIQTNFANPVPDMEGTVRPINLVVYVGESTTSMHWALYGYGRDTNPKLAARAASDEGLMVMGPAFSTFTHTSLSLMDALGIRVDANGEHLPILQRRYVSVVEALKAHGIHTELRSNQGKFGSWNFGGRAVLGAAAEKHYSVDAAGLGNAEAAIERPYDGQFFAPVSLDRGHTPRAVFLHSYAGHGPYLNGIPPALQGHVDDSYTSISDIGLFGEKLPFTNVLRENLEAYDAAMRYVDATVDQVMQKAISTTEPTVVLYFSDHGESVWTGRSHDSARFVHEMARVPLLLYFNAEARRAYPELFSRYRALASNQKPVALSSVSKIILDLFGLSVRGHGVGSEPLEAPHLVNLRGDHEDLRAVNLGAPFEHKPPVIDEADIATQLFSLALRQHGIAHGSEESTMYCIHRADTVARTYRGAAAAGCIEADVIWDAPTRQFVIAHPPAQPTGYSLDLLLTIVRNTRSAFWLDGKGLNDPAECDRLATALETLHIPAGKILVEFPAETVLTDAKLVSCAKRLARLGTMPAVQLGLSQGAQCSPAASCPDMEHRVQLAAASGVFRDLTFDSTLAPLVAALPSAKEFRWNTWVQEPSNTDWRVADRRYRMIIMDSARDPNFH